jgi:hypothetical protein
MGKRKKRSPDQKLYASLRNTWDRNPRTRIKESQKIYNRKKAKKELHHFLKEKGRDGVPFYILLLFDRKFREKHT